MLHLCLFSTVIFMLTALLNLLTACLHPSRCLIVQGFLLNFIPILPIFLKLESTSIFTLSTLTLVNSELSFFVCYCTCLLLELFHKMSVKTPHVSISPILLFTGSGGKWKILLRIYFVSFVPLKKIRLCIHKNKYIVYIHSASIEYLDACH